MANHLDIEWDGLRELEELFGEMDDLLVRNMKAGMQEYDLLVETGARKLAPRYEGELMRSIIAGNVVVYGGLVVGTVGSNLSYAWRRHEEPYRRGKHPLYDNGIKRRDWYINGRGQRTRQKSSWRGHLPGRKFLENAVIATEGDFEDIFDEVLDATLRGVAY